MTDIRNEIERDVNTASKETKIRDNASTLELPVTPNLRSRSESFIRHADLTNQVTKSVAELFYPRANSNEPWTAHITRCLENATNNNEQTAGFVKWATKTVEAIRAFRNSSEHPDSTKEVTILDFAIKPGRVIVPPTIQMRHPDFRFERTGLSDFMEGILDDCSMIFEGMSVVLCDHNIRTPPMISACIALLDEKQSKARNGVAYGYVAHIHGLPNSEPKNPA
jgi:hypothetical protein